MLSTNPSLSQSYPRVVYGGVTQAQLGGAVYEQVPLPQHLPHCYFFAKYGTDTPVITPSEVFNDRYGADTTSPDKPYFNHATGMLNIFLGQGRTTLTERLIPPNAKKSLLRISLELIPAEIPQYQRHADGRLVYVLDEETGSYGPAAIPDSQPIKGWRVVIHKSIEPFVTGGPDAKKFGQAGGPINYRLGDLASSIDPDLKLGVIGGVAQQSKLYALFDAEIATHGKYGNRIGLEIRALTESTTPQINYSILAGSKAFPYQLRVMALPENALIPTPVANLDGDDNIPLILKDNVVSPTEGTPLSFNQYFVRAYGDPASINSKSGPFGRVHVYQNNITEILSKLINGDVAAGVVGEKEYQNQYYAAGSDVDLTLPENQHYLNILTGVDYKGIPAFAFDMSRSDDFGGVRFDEGTVVYADGGDDGLILDAFGHPDRLANLRLLDEMVRDKMKNYGVLGANMLNIARYPASAYYDSGFSIDTKKAMMSITAKRKDVVVVTGIHRIADFAPAIGEHDPVWGYVGQLTENEKRSVASTLYSNAQMIPESIIDGTGASRIAIVRGDTLPYDARIPYNVPLTFDVAYKASRYMGSTDGNWDGRYAFEEETVKVLEYVGQLDDSHDLTEPQASRFWEVGTCYPLYWDPTSLYWPYLRTVHSEPSSPLTSLEYVFGTCTAVKEAHKVFAILVGSNLEEAQFVERSNQLIADRLHSATRFAGKFRIIVDTKITAADRKRRYSWTTEITFASGDYKTVNSLKINAASSDYLNNQQA